MRSTLLTVFGLGTMPSMPGTAGSIPVALLVLLTTSLGSPWMTDVVLLLLLIGGCVVTVAFGEWAEKNWGCPDPPCVVSDEVAGQALTYLFISWTLLQSPWGWYKAVLLIAVGFIAFRILDIAKPPPIRQLQSLEGGWGILADDLAAGLGAGAVTWLVALVLSGGSVS